MLLRSVASFTEVLEILKRAGNGSLPYTRVGANRKSDMQALLLVLCRLCHSNFSLLPPFRLDS